MILFGIEGREHDQRIPNETRNAEHALGGISDQTKLARRQRALPDNLWHKKGVNRMVIPI